MAVLRAEEIYEQHIKAMVPSERLRLVELIAHDMANTNLDSPQQHSLLELEGLGAEIWQDIDAQSYVNDLRTSN